MNKNVFNMPNPVTIMGRSSSITNSFVNGIIPVIEPTEAEIKEALKILEQNEDDVRCVYCGDKKTEWDHLHPLIINKKHTGYITEIANLVPACGKCNQSKGNSDWKEWMLSNTEKSPKTRGIPDLDKRIRIIEKYDNFFQKKIINLEEIAGKDLWEKYQRAYDSIIFNMESAQKIMDEIKEKVSNQNGSSNSQVSDRPRKVFVVNQPKQNIENANIKINAMTKSTAIRLFQNCGFSVFGNITFSSENNSYGRKFWANPQIYFLNNDWWLILNDIDKREIHLFFIPAKTLSYRDVCPRSDKSDLIDLQINYNDYSFEDSRSKICFKKWFKKSLKY